MPMDHDAIDALARKSGALPEAVTDIRSRVLARFAHEEPEPATVERWLIETLKPLAGHLFPQAQTMAARLGLSEEAFNQMPPAWRLEQARTHQPQVTAPHPRRPVYRTLTPAELDSLKDLPFHERTTRGRQLQQTPLPTQG
jgi:hypothetical protein